MCTRPVRSGIPSPRSGRRPPTTVLLSNQRTGTVSVSLAAFLLTRYLTPVSTRVETQAHNRLLQTPGQHPG